jgi:hypothetical protein
VFAEKQKMHLT